MAIKVEIDNSYSLISGLNSTETKNLNQELSYPIPGAHFSKLPWYLKRKWLLKKKDGDLYFPTGLLSVVLDFLKNCNINYSISYHNQQPKSHSRFRTLKKDPNPLRYYQEEVIKRCIDGHRGVVESATATGKTRMITELIRELSLPTLIVVPSTQILYQFHNLLLKTFGRKLVGIIGDGKANYKGIITVATVQSLEKVPDSFWDKIQVLIIDEFHHSAAETYQFLNENKFQNIYYRYGFTGTNFRNDGSDLALQGILSNVLYSYSAINGINDGYLCPPIFKFIEFNHSYPGLPPDTWKKEYTDFIVDNELFNQEVSRIAKTMNDRGMSTIVFVKEIAHGKKLNELIPDSGFMNGENDSRLNEDLLSDFNSGKLKCLIGTSIIGEGVDTVRASCGIMAGGGKAESEIIQKIGRLLRLHPDKKFSIVIDFMHKNSKWALKHSKAREKIYKSYGCDILYNT